MRAVITGAGSGIGKATAEKLLEKGHEVVAVDIDGEALEELPERDEVEKYQADVYDEDRISNVIKPEDFDAVVNCAGYYEQGAVEDVGLETAESIFRANYFGAANVIKAAMPTLRENDGRIVNVSSVAGRLTVPFSGHYCASKHALEALSEALRMELHDSDVDVIVVEPGIIETGFNERARNAVAKYMPGSPHTERYQKLLEKGGMDGTGPEKPASTIVKALESSRPRKRYQSPFRAQVLVWLSRLLPKRIEEFLVRSFSGY